MTPEDALDLVTTREQFQAFLRILLVDLRAEQAEDVATPAGGYRLRLRGWENLTLEQFLDGMLAWSEDAPGRSQAPSWHEFGQLLLAGKSYE